MAILTVFELSTMNVDKYNKAINGLAEAGQGNPEGRLYHVASQIGFGTTLVPVLKKAGVEPVQPKVYPVQNYILGK